MAKRTPLSKKTRFEVFKRDKFTCQYCGRMAPDVVLEVDHINPVCNGGENDILNLVTSCYECNRGKGKHKLTENLEIKKSQEQLKLLQEKREQLDLLIEWKNSLLNIDNDLISKLVDVLGSKYTIGKNLIPLTECLSLCIKKYGYRVVVDVCYEYDERFINIEYIKNQCKYKKQNLDYPESKDIYYILAILANRRIISDRKRAIVKLSPMVREFEYGTDSYKKNIEKLKRLARKCTEYDEFFET